MMNHNHIPGNRINSNNLRTLAELCRLHTMSSFHGYFAETFDIELRKVEEMFIPGKPIPDKVSQKLAKNKFIMDKGAFGKSLLRRHGCNKFYLIILDRLYTNLPALYVVSGDITGGLKMKEAEERMFRESVRITRRKHGLNQEPDQLEVHYLAPPCEFQSEDSNQDIILLFWVVVKLLMREWTPDMILTHLHWPTKAECSLSTAFALKLLQTKGKLERKMRELKRASSGVLPPIESSSLAEQNDGHLHDLDQSGAAFASPVATKIGRFIPPQYRRRKDFAEKELSSLCNIFKLKEPAIPLLNIHLVEEENLETQLRVLKLGYEDITAKFSSFCNRLNTVTNLKIAELTSVISEKQLRIENLERQNELQRFKMEKLEFQTDRREAQRRRRNHLREIRKRRAQDSMLQLPPLN